MERLYLYLAKRDKKGVKMVATVDSMKPVNTTRISDMGLLTGMDLPPTWTKNIKKTAHDHRLEWELMIETANSYEELKSDLRGRGYRNVPPTFNTTVPMQQMLPRRPRANINGLPHQKTMLRKKR